MSVKDEIIGEIDDVIEKLKQQRDELRVQSHLANAEIRDEWEELEAKWNHFIAKAKQFRKEVEPVSDDVGAALSLLGEEIKAGYKRLKDAL